MTRAKFMSEIVKTYFSNRYITVAEAIIRTGEELKISNIQLEEWFGRGIYETLDSSRGRVS